MDDIVQCSYNPFHMCLKSRLSRHKWKCHNQEYMRDLDLQLQERLHPQQQEVEESWDDDNHPTYVPPVKPWWKKTHVAGQSATIRFGRGRRPRGPTYARGTIRSLFEDQEQATQRTAYDVATRPPCRNLFWGRSFRNNSVCLCRQSIHFQFIGSGFIFSLSDHFQFSFVSFAVFVSSFI
jgi:hypothetical protein